MNSLHGKHVLVLGLGLHGGAIGTIQWLASEACPPIWRAAHILVSDTKSAEQLASSVEKLSNLPNIAYIFGNQDELDLSGIDMIIRNPSVPRNATILQRAREMHIPIEMDSSLFFEYSLSKNIIGITGSKGKTTTSIAIATVMKAIDPSTVTIGVDGVSPLVPLTPSLSQNGRGDITTPVVFELSSWRLEALQEKKISPHIAVCTSIYKDHLNTYASFEEYIETKKQIIRNQTVHDIAILNGDDEIIRRWKNDVRGKLYWYSLEPLQDNEEGIWVDGDGVFVHTPTPPPNRRGDSPLSKGEKFDDFLPSYEGRRGGVVKVASISDIPHTSPHELRNKLPAILIGLLHKGETSAIINALKNQQPLPHRLQFVRSIHGVDYINDSAATMPDATIAALQSFEEKPLILILGGSDKALEFEELAQEIASHKNIKQLIWLPGTATDRMKNEILATTAAISHDASTMPEAVRIASNLASSGDTVLLSPGATSFGLFLHEFDRGDSFIRAVEKL